MILIVDDNRDICDALERLMRRHGFDAECVLGGREALARLRAVTPEAVVLDDMMPGVSGLDVLRAIAADAGLRGLPVIMYSAGADDERRREALRLGAVEWVSKGRTGWLALLAKVTSVVHG